jgi:DNA invertase Pin-like site-specific DNA recombinase
MPLSRIGAALVVYSLSRLARNTRETIEIGECPAECVADLVSLREKIDTTSAADKTLVASEADRKRLARVRQLYREGKSVRAIATKLAAEDYTTKRGSPMNKSTVHELLIRR